VTSRRRQGDTTVVASEETVVATDETVVASDRNGRPRRPAYNTGKNSGRNTGKNSGTASDDAATADRIEDEDPENDSPGVYCRWEVELPTTPAEEVEYEAWQREQAAKCKTRSSRS
jgi:hypothetical protein